MRKREARYFDSYVRRCPYFTSKTDVNNGYGCNHPKQEERDNNQGKCYCFSCPMGYPADKESLNEPGIDWISGKPEPDDIGEDEYIILDYEEINMTLDELANTNTLEADIEIAKRIKEFMIFGQIRRADVKIWETERKAEKAERREERKKL